MQKPSYSTFSLPNYPIVLGELPISLKNELLDRVKETKGDDVSSSLAGHISREVGIGQEEELWKKLAYIFENISAEYWDEFPEYGKSLVDPCDFVFQEDKPLSLTMKNLWINYQLKNEFIPLHSHSGAFSFVIWLDIPYNMEEEKDFFDHKKNMSSLFSFAYTDVLGKLRKHPIEHYKTEDSVIFCLFPSGLSHLVYPFYTTDKERITISGNVFIKTDEDV